MSCICITGANQAVLDLVAKVLNGSEMRLLPSSNTPPVTKQNLGDELGVSANGFSSTITPQRLSEVVQAARLDELHGWADTGNLLVLNQWLRIEPTLRFVLVTSKIVDVLADAIDDYESPFDCFKVIRDWKQQHELLLAFYYRHRERCLLVDGLDCLGHAQEFVHACKQRFSELFVIPTISRSILPKSKSIIAGHLSRKLLENYPEAVSLENELTTCVTRFSKDQTDTLNVEDKNVENTLITEYRTQREKSQASLNQWVNENTLLLSRVKNIQAENRQLFNKNQALITQNEILSEDACVTNKFTTELKSQLEITQDQAVAAKIESNNLSKNNERLFFDLYEVQRGLEASFARNIELVAHAELLEVSVSDGRLIAEDIKIALEQSEQKNVNLQEKLTEIEAENDILLSQFQISLIDLENYVLKNRSLQETIASKENDVTALEARLVEVVGEYESLSQAHVQWLAERTALINEIELKERALSQGIEEAERIATAHQLQVTVLQENQRKVEVKNDTLVSEITQSFLITENYKVENTLLQASISAEKKHAEALEARLLEQTTAYALLNEDHIQWLAERESLVSQIETNKDEISEFKRSHVALILELAKEQKLAEHQFIENASTTLAVDTLESEKIAFESRLVRVLQKYPRLAVYDRVEVLKVSQGDNLKVQWQLVGLETGKQLIPSMLFSTILEDTALGFCFSRQQHFNSGFIRWPSILATAPEMVLSPVGDATTGPIRAEVWLSLATNDLEIFSAVLRSFEEELSSSHMQIQLGESVANHFLAGLIALKGLSNDTRETFRYDQVRLKREIVNDDYEHLWLEFENVSFNNILFGHFEFRLACSELIAKRFGRFPKLEFPYLKSRQPLNSWFAESKDDFGEKLELRFALPEAFDGEVWGRLSNNDQKFIQSLLERLPTVLREIELSGTVISRPWPQWQVIVEGLNRCLNHSIEATTSEVLSHARQAELANDPRATRKVRSSNKARVSEVKTTKRSLAKVSELRPSASSFLSFVQEQES